MTAPHFEKGTHHCAIVHSEDHGATLRNFRDCTLHPGHKDFMTVKEFKNKTPVGLQDKDRPIIENLVERTVRVVVNHTSDYRPDTFKNSQTPYPCSELRGNCYCIRYGTGYLVERYRIDVKESCCCPDCKPYTPQTPERQSYFFVIKTATHVVFDKDEAQNARFEFHYDCEDGSEVAKIHGHSVLGPDHNRLETDRCFVLCSTHDGKLADELDELCDKKHVPYPIQKVLVSHPHGASKTISVGEIPQRICAVNTNKEAVQIKKGTKIRFTGGDDDVCAVKDRLLDKRIISIVDQSKNFVLMFDLIISRPKCVIVETKCHTHWDNTILEEKKEVWWNVFLSDTQLKADDYTFPTKEDEESGAKLEVLGKIKSFSDRSDKGTHCVFTYNTYDVPSCPGSSGAHVKTFEDYFMHSVTGGVHFGKCKDLYNSSLSYVLTPYDHQEYEINGINNEMWTDVEDWRQEKADFKIISETNPVTRKQTCSKNRTIRR